MRKQRHATADAKACPMEQALDVMGGKWKGVILFRLTDAPVRFNTLHRQLCRITARSLTQALRELEADGMVIRTLYPTIPPHVDYALTDRARDLLPVLNALMQWSLTHVYDVQTTSQPPAMTCDV